MPSERRPKLVLLKQTPFDPLFEQHRGDIPLPYLRTLAYRESSLNPNDVHPASHATGLFQITTSALTDFNRRNGVAHRLPELTDPALNTQVATQHIQRIVQKYAPIKSLAPDWSSPRWVALLTQGWNAGHNALAGIVKAMEKAGIPPERITPVTVQQAAATKGVPFLSDPARAKWAQSVASIFANGGAIPQSGASTAGPMLVPVSAQGGSQGQVAGGGKALAGLVAVVGLAGLVVLAARHFSGEPDGLRGVTA